MELEVVYIFVWELGLFVGEGSDLLCVLYILEFCCVQFFDFGLLCCDGVEVDCVFFD